MYNMLKNLPSLQSFIFITTLLLTFSCGSGGPDPENIDPNLDNQEQNENNKDNNNNTKHRRSSRKDVNTSNKNQKPEKPKLEDIPFTIKASTSDPRVAIETPISIKVEIENNAPKEKNKNKREVQIKPSFTLNGKKEKLEIKNQENYKVGEENKLMGFKFIPKAPGKYKFNIKLIGKGIKVAKPATVDVEVVKKEDLNPPQEEQPEANVEAINKVLNTTKEARNFGEITQKIKDEGINIVETLLETFDSKTPKQKQTTLQSLFDGIITNKKFSYKELASVSKISDPLGMLSLLIIDPNNASQIDKVKGGVIKMIKAAKFDDLNAIKIKQEGLPTTSYYGLIEMLAVPNKDYPLSTKSITAYGDIKKALESKAAPTKWTKV